ncbi:membrane metallo-endopeptidase-like 1 isoform X1 [Clavelina lepadiformis]|uniref:membrane metallo-endopeptidase-like 1 isoform X1 n=1 Tax=Clavelina lepadiformis TaxID=159417 RepID=UPI004041A6D3
MCQIQVRYGGWGNDPMVKKSCKKRYACKNDYRQNFRNAGGKYGSTLQCNGGPPTSVCTCCCSKDLCNKDSWECKPRGTVVTTLPPPKSTTTAGETQSEICESPACVTAASRILNAMNRDADPCNDFFEYACGTWNVDHIIPDDQSSVSTFNTLRDDVSKVLKTVLERPSNGDRDSVVKAKNFYASCMNTSVIDTLGVDPVKALITEMGGWPVIGDPFDSSAFNFEDTLGKFRSVYGTYGIMSSWVSADDKNSSVNIFQMDQPSLGMPDRDYYLNEDTRDKTEPGYRQFMINFMTMIAGSSADSTKIANVSDEIIDLETELAKAMAPDSERRDTFAIYNRLTLTELSTNVSGDIDWVQYMNKVLEVTDGPLTATADEEIVIYDPEYLKNVTSIINSRWELVQNYLVWRVLKDRVSYMSADLRETRAPYTEAVSGTTSEEARWLTCSDTTEGYFEMPVGSLFVEEAFPEKNKAVTLEMVENIRVAFKGFLPANDWMDDQTKSAAEVKADQVTPIIAYPDYILDASDPKMDNDYDMIITPNEYFKSIQELVVWGNKNSFGKLREPIDFTEWITGPAIVNAFYSPSRNQIVFPAGILQPPFYDAGQPNSMNYGGIGMVIGHEITHGFDDSGSQYDGHGNLNNWWTDSSKENFNNKSQCMIDQYSSMTWAVADNRNLNGELTLGENIADNGGIREAYTAYKTWQSQNPQGDLRLPGLGNFTQDQLFFLGYGQVWCGTYKEAYAIRLLTTDPHSPGEFRVNVPSMNFPEFGEAYGCQKGKDGMYPNPEDTCRVW